MTMTPAQRKRVADLLGKNVEVLADIGIRQDEVSEVTNRLTKATYDADAARVRRESGQVLMGVLPNSYEALRYGVGPIRDEFGDEIAPGIDWKSLKAALVNSFSQADDQLSKTILQVIEKSRPTN